MLLLFKQGQMGSRYFVLLLCLLLVSPSVLAKSNTRGHGKVIAGWVENISFPGQVGITKAKLDSGAKTSSIHAENIQNFRRNGERWVRFDLPVGEWTKKAPRKRYEKKRVRKVRIKNHNGKHDRRTIVSLAICFDGRMHELEFSLADRREFIYPVLLGREFLAGVAVIDSTQTFFTQSSCPFEK